MTATQFSMTADMQQQMLAFMAQHGLKVGDSGKFEAEVSSIANFGSNVGLDRLVRKEDSLGAIRELQPPTGQIGLQLFPFYEVDSDDVIFDYIKGALVDGLTPARAEDAESELSQKDDLTYGQGRASIIDWAKKDKYTASDVTRYKENLRLQQLVQGAGTNLNLNDPGNMVHQFNAQVARDDARRSRKLFNRLEWLDPERPLDRRHLVQRRQDQVRRRLRTPRRPAGREPRLGQVGRRHLARSDR